MGSNVKLNFRHVPLKLPIEHKLRALDLEQPPIPTEKKNMSPKKKISCLKWYYFSPLFFFAFYLIPMRKSFRTLVKLNCIIKNRRMSCDGNPKGTFIVEVLDKCSQSIYEVDGVPFHIAFEKDMYRVPAKSLTVSNIDGDCMPKAYLDSLLIEKKTPFSWVTTSQHTWFSIKVDGKQVVDKADVLFFKSVKHGNWIAYMFDMEVTGRHIEIIGDGHDIIYIYGV